MLAAEKDDLRGLLRSARRFPRHRDSLLRQALRIAQRALAKNAQDNEAVCWLGVVWWQMGERRRGWALLESGKIQVASCKGKSKARRHWSLL